MASQRILVLVKPDGVRRHLTGEVLHRIERKGYSLSNISWVQADEERLARHYAELVNRPFYPALVEYMMSGPMVAAIFTGDRVIEGVRSLAGSTDPTTAAPGTIRGDLGRAWSGESTMNIVHASDSPENAEKEIAIWFGEAEG
ncbi:MAG: nucleoside-diphosphate kinase [Ancrocorticia sp.]|jgi:nucleoside-diphosphate kinase|nr:nucleoside-diphosphate kinase [Ancrocorticia sp.]MCI1895422.1 nucleoside-diphosphate kinase [Ancrocorticia sp.]MCI1932989.1 nucleoside-diphosphate kinase [Ancrocorticia sp.]MCI1963332.1 nucleoside-diphosphate kinase [Ancrocorticia sp.]MCI2002819.1 nucleoside-diphosphate kinase [Ancrocorticia sp.]